MKIRSMPRLASMLLVTLVVAGCGADCESLCEDEKECEGADQDRDCATYCKEVASRVEKAGCEDQYDELKSCEGAQEDVCRPEQDACAAETQAYSDCMTDYGMQSDETREECDSWS